MIRSSLIWILSFFKTRGERETRVGFVPQKRRSTRRWLAFFASFVSLPSRVSRSLFIVLFLQSLMPDRPQAASHSGISPLLTVRSFPKDEEQDQNHQQDQQNIDD